MISSKAAVIEVLTKAQAMVSAGWCQYVGRIDDCVCPVQAIVDAVAANPRASFIQVASLFKSANGIDRSIDQWNDLPERTQPQVVSAFTKAIDFARAA